MIKNLLGGLPHYNRRNFFKDLSTFELEIL